MSRSRLAGPGRGSRDAACHWTLGQAMSARNWAAPRCEKLVAVVVPDRRRHHAAWADHPQHFSDGTCGIRAEVQNWTGVCTIECRGRIRQGAEKTSGLPIRGGLTATYGEGRDSEMRCKHWNVARPLMTRGDGCVHTGHHWPDLIEGHSATRSSIPKPCLDRRLSEHFRIDDQVRHATMQEVRAQP